MFKGEKSIIYRKIMGKIQTVIHMYSKEARYY